MTLTSIAQTSVRPAELPRPSMAQLFEENVAFVWRILGIHGVQPSEVEDAAQEVFLTAHRRMLDWDPQRASARTWLFGIAVRVASNFRRSALRAKRRTDGLSEAPPGPGEKSPLEIAETNLALERVEAAIFALDDSKRDVFLLFELEEMPMKEVAAAVGCPLQTAYARLYAARREVAAAIEGGRS